MKNFIRQLILNRKRIIQKDGHTYFTRSFLPNPLAPLASYETHMLDIFKTVLTLKKGTVIDVGANIGQTLNSILQVDPECPYVGFEPQPYACSLVDIFIVENNLKNKIILPIGLSDHPGIVSFESFGHDFAVFYNSGATMITDCGAGQNLPSHKRHILVERGDDVLNRLKISDISLIKIDVEGAEINVLYGLTASVEQHRPFMTLEILPPHLRGGNIKDFVTDASEIFGWLYKHNLKLYQIVDDGFVYAITNLEQIKQMTFDAHKRHRDYVAVPNEWDAKWTAAYGKVK